MSQFDEVLESPEWAFAFAAALEQQVGDDRILTVGSARPNVAEVVGDEPTRTIALRFTTGNGYRGSIVMYAVASFAEVLERAAADNDLATACAAAFAAATKTIAEQAVVEIQAEPGYDIDSDADAAAMATAPVDADVAVLPLLDGGDVRAALTLRVGAHAETGPEPEAEPNTRSSSVIATGAPGIGADADRTPTPAGQTAAGSGASYVLADVEMGVTAELGRCRMTMRELLSITPGAVIDLDRAAGAPVDVLVNGTLIARGEVVVVDEEFGIRISELVPR